MSTDLLVPPSGVRRVRPAVISREKNYSFAAAEAAGIKSSEQSHVLSFSLGDIRLVPTDPPSEADRRTVTVKVACLSPSMRAAVVMFLATSLKFSVPSRIVIITRANTSIAAGLKSDLEMLFPVSETMEIKLYAGDDVDELYAHIGSGGKDDSEKKTYLVSLGVTRRNHASLVRFFKPKHALMGVESGPTQDYRFYDGELWIPPFGGPTKVLYLRAKIPEKSLSADPELVGRIWRAQEIANSTEYFRYVTNETAMYLNPYTGTDRYLFDQYPNDYSHMFCLATAALYLSKVFKPDEITDERVLTVFRLLIRAE